MAETSTRKSTTFSDGSMDSTSAEWDRGPENTPVFAVVSAVADASGVDPLELPPLNEAVDPEALNDLFAGRADPAVETVTFRYAGYDVVVRGSGEVEAVRN